MASMLHTIASNSTAFYSSKLTTPEHLSLVAALLPAIAYPLLASGAAHLMLVWSAGLNFWSYHKQFELFTEEEPDVHIHGWKLLLSFLYLIIGWNISQKEYRQHRPKDTFLGVALLIFFSEFYWLGYAFDALKTSETESLVKPDLVPLTRYSVITTLVSFHGWFWMLGRPLSLLVSRLTARRVPWLFRFYKEDIEANAKAYTAYTFDDFHDDVYTMGDIAANLEDNEAGLEDEDMETFFKNAISTLLVCITMLGLVVYQF
ncbi:hypothetical protein GGI35DRAFT_488277 [Trichoderma velutinum]